MTREGWLEQTRVELPIGGKPRTIRREVVFAALAGADRRKVNFTATELGVIVDEFLRTEA
jgi:hypothetical protein